ncbi:F-box protein At2g02240 [Amborella trichopoda]|uniref:F-box protein At2g02240 n=1 Tax=Amborella trichopoda TaxID=13333 RepID=UPI0005D35E74|nr:F-box protein At2g02240 [Amborella trichopoda]|eukprot:XP_011628142.1 F-box protein At2g02240 [Amborella trichopoda]
MRTSLPEDLLNPPENFADSPETKFSDLPENCISHILSLMGLPKEVCRMGLVSKVFLSASIADTVWERLMPPDIIDGVLKRSVSEVVFDSKKELFLKLCFSPILIDGGRKCFSLDVSTGKKCYIISAREMTIIWGDDERYWHWNSLPESRFSEVATLSSVCWLEINAELNASMLSPKTQYVAVFVMKYTEHPYGLGYPLAKLSLCMANQASPSTKMASLLPLDRRVRRFWRSPLRAWNLGPVLPPEQLETIQLPRSQEPGVVPNPRPEGNGWMELEVGEFFVDEDSGNVQFSLLEIEGGHWKSGIIIEGLEIRPKGC